MSMVINSELIARVVTVDGEVIDSPLSDNEILQLNKDAQESANLLVS